MSWKQRKSDDRAKDSTVSQYKFLGRPLSISETADFQPGMQPGGAYHGEVQKALNAVTHRTRRAVAPYTFKSKSYIPPMAVRYEPGSEISWGVHRLHKAQNPGLSPFIHELDGAMPQHLLTVELSWKGGEPTLVRAYGGDYTPPLIWMGSARDAVGGRNACRQYWQNHAYVDLDFGLIKKGTLADTPPRWYTAR